MCLIQSTVTVSFSAPQGSSTMPGASVFSTYLSNGRNLIFYVKSPTEVDPKPKILE